MLDIVDESITSGLRPNEASSPVHALASQHTGELVLELFVGTKEEANFPCTSANITSCE